MRTKTYSVLRRTIRVNVENNSTIVGIGTRESNSTRQGSPGGSNSNLMARNVKLSAMSRVGRIRDVCFVKRDKLR